jgi:hybrid cluster-associated redox disulfide protein
MCETPVTLDTAVEEVMRRAPATIRVFLRLRLQLCVGCPVGAFHSVADAARHHGLAPEALLADLRAAAAARPPC